MKTLSLDLRERIVSACDDASATRQEIAERYNVSLGMVKKLLSQRRRTGDIAARHRFSGAKPKLTAEHRKRLLGFRPQASGRGIQAAGVRLQASGFRKKVPAVLRAPCDSV